jgi:PurA-like ssDNA and RNA-binding protein
LVSVQGAKRCNGIGIPSQNVMDNVIITRELQVERKHFYIEFRENERGRFMRITEEAHGRRNTIIIPSTGLDEFMSAAGEVIQSADRVPAAS